jgi:hypothetical protein
VLEECISLNGKVGMFSFVGPCRPYIPCNWQRTHLTSLGLFRFCVIDLLSGHLCILRISVKVAVVFDVPVSLAVCTLGNVSFVSGRFKFYFEHSIYLCYSEQVAV